LTPPLLHAPKPPPARARHVVFEDEVTPYPAIRSPGQQEGYKGVFQDQLAEYTELLGEVRATRRGGRVATPAPVAASRDARRPPSGRQDWAFLEKQQRCEYLKKKLTHIKARIQDYDRDARDSTGRF
uniref:OCEL domain-containing protein n=1 Tax=Otus sunia TaxID=257818 RepID=A0A8C8AZE6_9STRI